MPTQHCRTQLHSPWDVSKGATVVSSLGQHGLQNQIATSNALRTSSCKSHIQLAAAHFVPHTSVGLACKCIIHAAYASTPIWAPAQNCRTYVHSVSEGRNVFVIPRRHIGKPHSMAIWLRVWFAPSRITQAASSEPETIHPYCYKREPPQAKKQLSTPKPLPTKQARLKSSTKQVDYD